MEADSGALWCKYVLFHGRRRQTTPARPSRILTELEELCANAQEIPKVHKFDSRIVGEGEGRYYLATARDSYHVLEATRRL